MTLRSLILVALGGGVGSAFRYLTTWAAAKYLHGVFPLATLAVNLVGCFIIGLLLGAFEHQQWSHPDLKFLLVTGFCGGYTTFSAFAAENLSLLQSGNTGTAFLYIAASVTVGLAATLGGFMLTK
jgi:CrcB protein